MMAMSFGNTGSSRSRVRFSIRARVRTGAVRPPLSHAGSVGGCGIILK
jgi:hypothetical protein